MVSHRRLLAAHMHPCDRVDTPPVVVVGHTSCGGCVAAHGSSPPISTSDSSGSPLIRFLGPLIRLRHSLPIEASLDELIEENVKLSVKNVVDSEVGRHMWLKRCLTFSR